MSSTDIEDETDQIFAEIEAEGPNLTSSEQNFLEAWVAKLKSVEDKDVARKYLDLLKMQVTRMDKHLSLPYIQMPPEDDLPPLEDLMGTFRTKPPSSTQQMAPERWRYFCPPNDPKQPCRPKSQAIQKSPERPQKSEVNQFENAEEMAKCIAKSKGMVLAEFVASISVHTRDNGHELIMAMKEETASFEEYVDRMMAHRIKDIGDLLDDKQNNELIKIQKEYDKWQSELLNCKKGIKDMIPNFDLEAYRKDKNYFQKTFTPSSSDPPDEDKFKEWKEEHCLRLKWLVKELEVMSKENDEVLKKISAIKLRTLEMDKKEKEKQQRHAKYIHAENMKCKELKQENDKLSRKIAQILLSLEN